MNSGPRSLLIGQTVVRSKEQKEQKELVHVLKNTYAVEEGDSEKQI